MNATLADLEGIGRRAGAGAPRGAGHDVIGSTAGAGTAAGASLVVDTGVRPIGQGVDRRGRVEAAGLVVREDLSRRTAPHAVPNEVDAGFLIPGGPAIAGALEPIAGGVLIAQG